MKLKAPEGFQNGPLPKTDQKESEIKQFPLIGSLQHLRRKLFQKPIFRRRHVGRLKCRTARVPVIKIGLPFIV